MTEKCRMTWSVNCCLYLKSNKRKQCLEFS